MEAWLLFALGCVALCVFLYFPGYFANRASKLPAFESLLLAPVVSVFAIEVIATINLVLGIRSSWLTVILPAGTVCVILYAALRFASKSKPVPQARIEGKYLKLIALYAVVGIALGCWLFLRPIQSPEMFAQVWDNASHVNSVQSFLESGQYRIIGSSLYVVDGQMVPSGGFYPTAYYSVAALVAGLLGLSAPCAINVVNFVFSCIVYPLGCLLLLSKLFNDDNTTLFAGAFVCLGLVAFPWRFLHWGTISPNLIAFCMIPAAVWLFANLFSGKNRTGGLLSNCVLALITLCTLVLSQPNAVFTLGVLILPYILVQLYCYGKDKDGNNNRSRGVLYAGVFLLLTVVMWFALRKLPFLVAIVNTSWESISTPLQAFLDILSMRLPGAGDPDAMPQLIMAVLCAIGCIVLVRQKKNRWLIASFIVVAIIYFVDASSDGRLKFWVAGFWYTDPSRTAAMVTLAAVPLCSHGMGWVLKKIYERLEEKPRNRSLVIGILLAVFVLVNYAPTISFENKVSIPTAFGGNESMIVGEYRQDQPIILDAEEVAFLKEVRNYVPNNALVLNQVCDGSVFAYGAAGVSTVYRSFFGLADSEEEDPVAYKIQRHLDQIANRPDVLDAVRQTGATYYLQLDAGGGNKNTVMYSSPNFSEGITQGMDAVTPNTLGFSVVFERDDMILYKITALDL